jgi:hypothetical protein
MLSFETLRRLGFALASQGWRFALVNLASAISNLLSHPAFAVTIAFGLQRRTHENHHALDCPYRSFVRSF